MANSVNKIVRFALDGTLPIIIFAVAILVGILALQLTPREEEPQIVVPIVDVTVSAPGLNAQQVERQVTTPLEKLLSQIPGVEHIYSSSKTGETAVTLRFYVGEDREDSILNTYNKLHSNQDKIPAVVQDWFVQPVEVDDVPILLLAFWSEDPYRYDDYDLRRIAEDVSTYIQSITDTSEVKIVGGRPRTIQLLIDPESLSAHQTSITEVINALQNSNALQNIGRWTFNNESIVLESGDFIRDIDELKTLVVNVINNTPIFLQDLVTITDGAADPESYTWIDFTPQHPKFQTSDANYPMVTISVAKQRGSNAVTVAANVHELLEDLRGDLLPPEIHIETIRDYGKTANEKVNNLTQSLAFAIFTVVVFISIFLGWRAATVIALALPVCYGITLGLDMAFGYTINRVTLFALILSLGLLVDDPITGVDNISRYMNDGKPSDKKADVLNRIVDAMAEIRVPLIMSTITIVLAFIPLAFISGMMGPYMAPMAFNVPISVITSTLVAFLITPWLSSWLLKKNTGEAYPAKDNRQPIPFYHKFMTPILDNRRRAKAILWFVFGLFLIATALPLFRFVPLKLLPFDNKNEIQIIIDMPENTSLEKTAAMASEVSHIVRQMPEVSAIAAYVGTPSPNDFNGMVRRYYQRKQPYLADLRVNLIDKSQRQHQSHAIVLRMRDLLKEFNINSTRLKIVEVPPGPPVLSTLTVEIYGDRLTSYEQQQIAAKDLMARLNSEAHVVEVDSSIEDSAPRWQFITDKQKAALSGISTQDINDALAIANDGYTASYLHLPGEANPLPIELRLAPEQKVTINDFERIQVNSRIGVNKINNEDGLNNASQTFVSLGELGHFEQGLIDHTIYHKDLEPVVYVTAELSGRTPAEVIADVHNDRQVGTQNNGNHKLTDWRDRNFIFSGGNDLWNLPKNINIKWRGEGEWRITVDVFRDMGIAFAFALLAIFVVLRIQTSSAILSLIIMSAIPLTIIGIMPGFWLINQFGEREIAGAPDPILFTATAMIGMIALAGIVVRNSLILVEFITQARNKGLPIKQALLEAGTVRMRPVLLTAGTTLLGNLIITLDPVFSGLALAIIFGIIASTLFTLVVVPVVYSLVFDKTETQIRRST